MTLRDDSNRRLGRAHSVLDATPSVAVLVAVALFIWRIASGGAAPSSRAPIAPPLEPQPLDATRLLGEPTSPVGMIVYSEFQCPFCARFALDSLPVLRTKYIEAGKLQIAFRHLPLIQRHAEALPAARAAECAGSQGHFWQMHDALFDQQRDLPNLDFVDLAMTLGLDKGQFTRCLATDMETEILEDAARANSMGISGTPTFLVGSVVSRELHVKVVISGARPVVEFERTIDQVLAQLK